MSVKSLSYLCITAIYNNPNLLEDLERNSNYLPKELKEMLVDKITNNLKADDTSSLSYAINDRKKTPLICFLIKNDPKYNEIKELNRVFAFANRSGNLELVRLLIETGAGIDTVDQHGQTALHIAARYGNLELAGLLIEAGAQILMPPHEKAKLHCI